VNHYLQQLFPRDADEQRHRCLRRQKPTKPICRPHEASWLYLRDPQMLSDEEHNTLKQVQAAHAEVDAVYEHVQLICLLDGDSGEDADYGSACIRPIPRRSPLAALWYNADQQRS
jgi:hypothetical protein